MNLAAELCERRIRGVRGGPLVGAPATLAEGFALQQATTAAMQQAGYEPVGWKCAMPSPDRWTLAPLFGPECFTAPGPAGLLALQGMARIEPEIAFTLARDLPVQSGGWSRAAVDAAIGSAQLAIELIGSRFAQPGLSEFPALLADGLFNQGLVLGPEIDRHTALAAKQFQLTLQCGQAAPVLHQANHPCQDPTAPLHWLANFLNQQGLYLRAGERVITGSYCGVLEVPLDQAIELSYQGLGQVQFRCVARSV